MNISSPQGKTILYAVVSFALIIMIGIGGYIFKNRLRSVLYIDNNAPGMHVDMPLPSPAPSQAAAQQQAQNTEAAALKSQYVQHGGPSDKEIRFGLSKKLQALFKNRPEEVMSIFSQKEFVGAMREYNDLLIDRNRWGEAMAVCSTLIKIDGMQPAYPAYRTMQAQCLLSMGNLDGSIKICREVRDKWPDFAPVHYIEAKAAMIAHKKAK